MKFAEIFKALRKDKNLTQEQISEVFNVSPQIISRWENDISQPNIDMLPIMASYFETTVDHLLGIKEPIKKQKILFFQFRYEKSADIVNDYLDNGWTIKEMQTHPLKDQHPEGVVIIEKIVK